MPTLNGDYFSKMKEKQLVFFWLFFCFIALTYNLGEVPPYHSDENFYVESSRNMVQSGDYLTPVYHDKKRFAKPIFYYWIVSVSYKVFGISLDSARLTSAFFSCLTIGLLYLIAKRLFEGRVALYSILILPATFLHYQISRWATTDIVMNFFILLTLYYFVRLYQNNFECERDSCLLYISMALGFMTKGPVAVLIPSLAGMVFILVTRRKKFFSKLIIGRGVAIVFLINIPWFAVMYYLHGEEFRNHIVGAEIEGRLVHNTPFSFYYFGVLLRYHLPWSLFFIVPLLQQFGIQSPSSLSNGWKHYFGQIFGNIKIQFNKLMTQEHESTLLCYIWILVCLILFVLVRTEHSRYMLPAAPAMAILVAKIFANIKNESVLEYKIPLLLTSLIFFLAAILSSLLLYALNLTYVTPLNFWLIPFLFVAVGAYILKSIRNEQFGNLVFVISFSLVFVFSFLSGDVLSHASRSPMKLFSERILSEKIFDHIAIYGLGNQRAKLGVLTGRKVLTVFPGQEDQFLDTNERVLVVMKANDFKKNFSDSSMKLLAEDRIWLEGRVDWNQMKELWGKAKVKGFSNLTEKVYLLSNR